MAVKAAAAYPMDETRKFDFAVYELSFETCRHPCQAFIFRAAFVNQQRFFSKSERRASARDETSTPRLKCRYRDMAAS